MISRSQAIRIGRMLKGHLAIIHMPSLKVYKNNGRCCLWKRNPDNFLLPIKDEVGTPYFVSHQNAHQFRIVCPEMVGESE